MKTYIKTIIAASVSAIMLSTSAFATTIPVNTITVSPVKKAKLANFRKISVKGNVEVTLVQGTKMSISYSDDNLGSAKVIRNGDLLQISASSNEPTKLILCVNDLFRIEASENASIKTQGKLNTQFLQIFLKENAVADINTTSQGLYTVISDNANLKLSGATDDHTLIISETPKLTMDRFAALNTTTSSFQANAVEKEIAKAK
ncbi:hypothetical protein EZ449_13655 [Pedobacter frigidisoli]|uniref:Putative auto-transporter adhesin head GIN domain-containing protein n=1 Tax=Pedobacter frigidisoli TaxID=2530455 RepID=A0A4R0P584_9SPHI|nr:DUF2807 domain-containing protein [Pedobacter frigidisoli]TCD07583.1 hypothetical protein EZ449_13655 [Pedobacter frigidisoli]